MMIVRLMTLKGSFAVAETHECATLGDAFALVQAYAAKNNFSKVKLEDDDIDGDGYRWTARTPGGRSGRNIAFSDGHLDGFEEENKTFDLRIAEHMISVPCQHVEGMRCMHPECVGYTVSS